MIVEKNILDTRLSKNANTNAGKPPTNISFCGEGRIIIKEFQYSKFVWGGPYHLLIQVNKSGISTTFTNLV